MKMKISRKTTALLVRRILTEKKLAKVKAEYPRIWEEMHSVLEELDKTKNTLIEKYGIPDPDLGLKMMPTGSEEWKKYDAEMTAYGKEEVEIEGLTDEVINKMVG